MLLGQLSDVEQKIKAIEKSGHTDILKKYQAYSGKRTNVSQYETDIEDLKHQIESRSNATLTPVIDDSAFDKQSENEAEVLTKLKNLNGAALSFKETIKQAVASLENELTNFKGWYSESDFNKIHIEVVKEYGDLIESLRSEGIDSPSDYARLIAERDTINKSLKAMELVSSQIAEVDSSINSAYQKIIECRKKLTISRLEFLQQNLARNSSIKVELDPFSDVDHIEESFRGVIGRSDNAFSADIFDLDRECGFLYNLHKELSATTSPGNSNNLEPWLSKIHEFKSQLFSFRSGEIQGAKIGKRFSEFMINLQPQSFDQINTWFPEDKLSIKFNDGNRFKDVSQGSAGQKASAILSFLLSYGTEPLVLDQPEDDLDNGLITSLIVSKLHENKSKRQIIVVTHNPNIVVNGDSEYVIALEDRGQINSVASGALQEVNVRKNVCEIMEGGEIALQQRYKRMFNI